MICTKLFPVIDATKKEDSEIYLLNKLVVVFPR
jgi:hypothetical protein